MRYIIFGGMKFIIESDESDRFGLRVLNIISPDTNLRLVATFDIRENNWLLSNGQKWEVGETWIVEEI
jgi:hypothetical protein